MSQNHKDNQTNIVSFIPTGEFYFTKGVEAFQKQKFDTAIKWLKKAVEKSPTEPLFSCQLSIVYTETGEYHQANHLLMEVLEKNGDSYVDCYYLLANNYAHLGLLDDAKKYAALYLIKDAKGELAEEARQLIELISDEEDKDEEDDWLLPNEDDILKYQESVFYHMEYGEWTEALQLLEQMIVLFPEHMRTSHDYTKALFFTGKEEEAIQMEMDILENDPSALNSHMNLAIYFHQLRKNEACKGHIHTLLNVYPIHEQQKLRIAITLAEIGLYQESYQRFIQLRRSIVQGHPSYYRWYSLAAFQLGYEEKAETIWQEGINRHQRLANERAPFEA